MSTLVWMIHCWTTVIPYLMRWVIFYWFFYRFYLFLVFCIEDLQPSFKNHYPLLILYYLFYMNLWNADHSYHNIRVPVIPYLFIFGTLTLPLVLIYKLFPTSCLILWILDAHVCTFLDVVVVITLEDVIKNTPPHKESMFTPSVDVLSIVISS